MTPTWTGRHRWGLFDGNRPSRVRACPTTTVLNINMGCVTLILIVTFQPVNTAFRTKVFSKDFSLDPNN